MQTKIKNLSLFLIASFCCFNLEAKTSDQSFKIAIVEEAAGSKEILKGQYQLGMKKLTRGKSQSGYKFNSAMGGCVVNIMMKELQKAKIVCNKAVEAYQSRNGENFVYLRAVAQSNRAVALYKLGDHSGALKDLESAASMDANEIVLHNLRVLKSKIGSVAQPVSQLIAD